MTIVLYLVRRYTDALLCLLSVLYVLCRLENPPEAGILPDALLSALDTCVEEEKKAERRATNAAASTSGSHNAAFASNGGTLFHPSEQSQIKESWKHLMRWSRAWRTVEDGTGILKDIEKVGAADAASYLHACIFAWPGIFR
jgi:hypothetical protein